MKPVVPNPQSCAIYGVSFVSITQSFNTTSSMGRLTLNVLLSFAQFEGEVIGERVRDKIAASKRKGLWVGGPVFRLSASVYKKRARARYGFSYPASASVLTGDAKPRVWVANDNPMAMQMRRTSAGRGQTRNSLLESGEAGKYLAWTMRGPWHYSGRAEMVGWLVPEYRPNLRICRKFLPTGK
jgi:hypothetical protein